LKGFSLYLGTSLINRAIPFFLLPVLTSFLTTKEYGILATFQVAISFSDSLIGLRMKSNITRKFFKESQEVVGVLIFNLILIVVFTASIALLIVSLLIIANVRVMDIPDRWVAVLPILTIMNVINSYNLSVLRNQTKAFEYGSFEISRTALDLGVSLLFVLVFFYGWEGRAMGILIASGILALVSIIKLWRNGYLIPKVDTQKIKEALNVSFPLVFHGLAASTISLSDRVFINEMVGTSALGVYAVGYQFGLIISIITTAFNLTWNPWLFEKLEKCTFKGKKSIVKATYLAGLGFLVITLIVTLLSHVLLPFMTAEEYHNGVIYVGWIAMAYFFMGLYSLIQPYGIYVGRTSYLGVITLFAALVNLLANYYLIKLNGALGAAQATLISYVLMFIAVWWYSNKLHPMPWFQFRRKVNTEE
jgi:O-antigen/teichoic acid export membrane protein